MDWVYCLLYFLMELVCCLQDFLMDPVCCRAPARLRHRAGASGPASAVAGHDPADRRSVRPRSHADTDGQRRRWVTLLISSLLSPCVLSCPLSSCPHSCPLSSCPLSSCSLSVAVFSLGNNAYGQCGRPVVMSSLLMSSLRCSVQPG